MAKTHSFMVTRPTQVDGLDKRNLRLRRTLACNVHIIGVGSAVGRTWPAVRRSGLPHTACRKPPRRTAPPCPGSEALEFLERWLAVLGQHHIHGLLQEFVDALVMLYAHE